MMLARARNVPKRRNLRKLTACDRDGVGVDFDPRSIKIGIVEHDLIYVLFAIA
jgi:hypothetical protein